ncbi:hypothetical protein U14_03038 [Candidatus Moduliflexus flocculans]|uniref:Lipoprotein n=1 Tax=Candidatus Moduliflexus flocculans TaxID=1499966 RepID=A0A081BN26_9BACT|nr:hypothetical protein U14_03038 [Candidatus Moduliflexus flocculans]
MKKQRFFRGLIVLGLAAAGMVGCHLFEDQSHLPTAPIEATSDQYSNFFAMRHTVSPIFEWDPGHDVFCVNVPKRGEYRLTYETNWGVFNIVFRAIRPTYMYIGLLENDVVKAIALENGTIPADAAPVADDDSVIRFATPASPISWQTVFVSGNSLPVPQGTAECRVITSTKNALSFQAAQPTPQKTSPFADAEKKARQAARINRRNARRQARQAGW